MVLAMGPRVAALSSFQKFILDNASVEGVATKCNSGNYITETGGAKDRKLHFSKWGS
jgi:hypothetical protein